MKQRTIFKKATQMIVALLVCTAMLAGQVLPVMAAGKATVKTVSGMSFKKGNGADKKINYLSGEVVSNGKCMLYSVSATDENEYIVTTKDGKTFNRISFEKLVQQTGVSKKNAKKYFLENICAVGNTIYLVCENDKETTTIFATEDGLKYKRTILTDVRPYDNPIITATNKYQIAIGEHAEGPNIHPKGNPGDKATAAFTFMVSGDDGKWITKQFTIEGIINADGDIEYNDAVRKKNNVVWLVGAGGDGEYLYLDVLFLPYNEAGLYEADEEYIYRTKDFETYEKVEISSTSIPKVSSHKEELGLTKKGIQYGIVCDWKVNEANNSYKLSTLKFKRAKNTGSEFEEVFTYNPAKYNSKTIAFTYNWKGSGKQVSLLFERKKDNSLFVSADGVNSYKEYSTSIKVSLCTGIWEDTKNGYKIMGYDSMKYLLFSRNGFVTTYKVKVPDDTQTIEIIGNRLSIITLNGNYYISLSDLYKKMK